MRARLGMLLAASLVALPAGLAGCGDDGAASSSPFNQARSFRDLRAQVRFGPRPAGSAANARLTRFLAARLRAAGARGVRIQRPHRNVVGQLPGRGRGAVVVGAHHDTKDGIPGFVGANDGASGVAVVLELARSLPRRPRGPSVHFALFDAEEARGERDFSEDGTRGSRQYVRYARRRSGRQGTPPLRSMRGMVLFDLVGDCDLDIPREARSDRRLYSLFRGPPFGGTTGEILDDHIPFLEAGVRAVDLIDFTFGPGPSPGAWWHTREDTLDKVCASSLGQVGRAAVRAIPRIR